MTPAKGYTEMKDSGIEWIPQIPTDWQVKRLKELFSFGKGLPITKADLVDSGVAVISYGQIHAKSNTGTHLAKSLLRYVPKTFLETNPSAILRKGDIVLADTSEDLDGLGNAALMDIDDTVFAGYHTIILHPGNADFSKYLSYLFRTDNWRSQLRANASGIKVFSVTQKMLRSCNLILPPKAVRDAITAYLDTQCAKIDEIIAQAKASIEDYKQWKASIIYEAVTKGLDPNVEMKDSGIEWIGKMPKHWQDINPKALFSQRKERANPGDRQLTASQQFGVIYQDEYMEMTGTKVVTVEKDFDILKHVSAGDFVISMRSFQGGLEYSTKSGSISSAYVMLVPNLKLVYPRYYRWLLKSNGYIRALQSTSDLVRDGQAMRYSNFAKVRLITLPLGEQEQIAYYLDTQCAKIDKLMAEKQSLIDDLESYKKSLIYEVVTGKRRVEDATQMTIAILSPEILRYRKALLMLRVLDLLGTGVRGRIQLQKCMFAAECLLNMPFHTQFIRYEHGPYDPELLNIEEIVNKNGWYTVLNGSPVTYQKGKEFEAGLREYMATFSAIDVNLRKIVRFLKPMKTSQAERVATLLAAWNDFIIDGVPNPTDKEIIDEVVTHWTPNKANPQYSTWQDTLYKMRENQFVPKGTGVHTQQKKSQQER